jgi:hypothetical protein
MSDQVIAEVTPAGVEIGSLADQLRFSREQRRQRKDALITLVVPGTGGRLAASYRRLGYAEKTMIARRHPTVGEDPAAELAAAADLLINACQDLLEVCDDATGERSYRSLGMRWTAPDINRLYGLALPDGATAREALLQALDDEDLMDHFGGYINRCTVADDGERERLPGESTPSTEG